MKLAAVLTAIDSNPFYVDLVALFVEAWKRVAPEVRIVIGIVATELPEALAPYAPLCHLIEPVENVHSAFVAQCSRLLLPGIMLTNELGAEDAVLIADISVIPCRRSYFVSPLAHAPLNAFVHYRSETPAADELSICYNAATPTTWANVFPLLNNSIADTLIDWWAGAQPYTGDARGEGWNADQRRLCAALASFADRGGKIVRLDDSAVNFKRLNPVEFCGMSAQLLKDIGEGAYADYRIWRPHCSDFCRMLNEGVLRSINALH